MDSHQNFTQQIPSRSFCVNYLGGFSLAGNTELLSWLVANNGTVQVEEPSLDRAYVQKCCTGSVSSMVTTKLAARQ